MLARSVVYEHGPGAGTGRLAEELAAGVRARLVPVLAGHGARRRARRLSAAAAREDAAFLVVASAPGDVVRAAPCPVAIVPPALAGARPPLLSGEHVLWAVALGSVSSHLARHSPTPVVICPAAPYAA
jgi:nucleotide-binding universal stress UspA family protein